MVPPPGQKSVLEELHETHLGASKVKAVARSYIWWPKMDDSSENVAKRCPSCQQASSSPPKAPLHSWEWSSQPWSRLHLDFAGPFMGHMFLVVVDSHSKWLDVSCSRSQQRKPLRSYNKSFLPTDCHQTHILCSIPFLHKWTGRKGSPNIQTRAQRNVTRHSERKTDQIPF